ncbi:hypothetical protein BH11GEM1_BH11GEM1_06690 [soil metagenome]
MTTKTNRMRVAAEPPTPPTKDIEAKRATCSFYLVTSGMASRKAVRDIGMPQACKVRNKEQLLTCFSFAPKDSVWVASDAKSLSALATSAPKARGEQRLLFLNEMKEITHHLYSAFFRYVVTASDKLKFLELNELLEVLSSPARDDLFVGGAMDADRGVVLLYRGNIDPLVVPLTWFVNRNSGHVMNPSRFAVCDYGQTVSLGDFEASTDSILYAFDSQYRRRAKARLLSRDNSLGASIKRLRLQQALRRSDFSGISEKQMARLERNEIASPRGSTLRIIAKTLGVEEDQLSSY